MSVRVQVLLVAGGVDGDDNLLSSTEVLTVDSPVWTMVTPLPRAVRGVGSVTLDNTVYMTGKVYCTMLYYIVLYCTILQVAKMLMMLTGLKFLPGVMSSRSGWRRASCRWPGPTMAPPPSRWTLRWLGTVARDETVYMK